jgi:non-heme chloroperoxidase
MNRRAILQSAVAGAGAAMGHGYAVAATQARPVARSTVVTRDGCELAHADWGRGRTVLLVHSWSMNSGIWRHQVRGLTQAGYRVVTFDRRGHGRSTPAGSGYDIDTLADDLDCVIEQLGLTDLLLVAHSMGAGEVVRYIAKHGPQRVDKVVLLAPVTPFLTKTPDNPYGVDAALLKAGRAKMAADFPRWAADNAAAYFRPTTSPETTAWGMRMLIETPMPVALACAEAFSSFDFRPDLAKLTLPTLVIHGDADASAPLAITGERTAMLVPNGKLVVIPGAPHGLYETDAQRVNEEIMAFARG